MFTKKIALLMIVFILAMSFEAAPSAQASKPAQTPQPPTEVKGDVVIAHLSGSEQAAAVSRLMNREGKANAKAFPLPEPKGSAGFGGDKSSGQPFYSTRAKPEAIAHPNEAMPAPERAPVPDAASGLTQFKKTYPYNIYITNYYSQMWDYYPWYTIGRIYFTDGIYDYYCTATLIQPDTVVTAAHCVYNTDNNLWYSGFIFCPGDVGDYWSGPYAYPNGCWLPYDGSVLSGWIAQKYYSLKSVKYDVAVLYYPYVDGTGQDVSDYALWLGYAMNLNPVQSVFTIGYPTNLGTGDWYSYTCTGSTFKKGKGVMGMGCPMESGSSGGPWIIGYQPYDTSMGWANSVVSGGVPSSGVFYGAQFTSSNIGTLCYYTGWC